MILKIEIKISQFDLISKSFFSKILNHKIKITRVACSPFRVNNYRQN